MLQAMFHRRTVRAVLAASALSCLAHSAWADPIIKVGDPPKGGTVDITITKKDGTTKTETIDITREGSSEELRKANKASDIATQLAGKGYNASVNSNGHVDISSSKIVMGKNTTGEVDKVVALGAMGPGNSAVCSWAGSLDPVGISGPTVYEASIGWDGFETSTTFGFGDFSPSTIDGLLSRVYDGLYVNLPPELQPNMHLNLATDEIRFDFPSSAVSPFIRAGNNSEFSWAVFSVNTPVPEPAAAAMFCSIAGVCLSRRRQI